MAPRSEEAPGTGGSRLSAARDWLRGRADTSLARLALLWFRRYFEASRNSGAAAAALYHAVGAPAALVIIAIFNLASGNENAFAERLITHMNLDGPTASIVHDLFGTTSDNLLAASVTVVIGFLIWGLSIGQLYQDVYARAWRIHVGTRGRPAAVHDLVLRLQRGDRGGAVVGVGAQSRRLAGAASGLDRRLDRLLALDPALPAPSQGLASLPPARRAPGDVRRSAGRSPPRRSGSGRR